MPKILSLFAPNAAATETPENKPDQPSRRPGPEPSAPQNHSSPKQATADVSSQRDGELLKTKLGQRALADKLQSRRIEQLKKLPGGVFRAPKLMQTIEHLVADFRSTRLVDPNLRFDVMIASTPEINAWVSMDHQISDIKVFYVVVTKGFLDLISNTEMARELVGDALAKTTSDNGENILAAVLAHEFGHACNGDLESGKVSNRVFNELNADKFGTRLLAAAGRPAGSMVKLMELFDGIRSSKSTLRRRLASALDEHPKPRFRTANIIDLVQTLQTAATARQQFGLPPEVSIRAEERPLRRDGVEQVSKAAPERVAKAITSPKYLASSLREKLQFIERYFASSVSTTDFMARKSVTMMVQEYTRLLQTTSTMEEVDLLVTSLMSFEAGLADVMKVKDDDPAGNCGAAVKQLRSAVARRKMELLAPQHPEGITFENFGAWALHVDRRVLMGHLGRRVYGASSLGELRAAVTARIDNDIGLRDEHGGSRTVTDVDEQFYGHVARRALQLTNDLEQTLDFMQSTFRLQHWYGEYRPPAVAKTWAAILFHVLHTPGVKFGRTLERLTQPKTSIDLIYTKALRDYVVRLDIYRRFFALRGKTPDLDPLSASFRYGVGNSRLMHRELTHDHIALLTFLDASENFANKVLNEIVGRQYNLAQTVELVGRAPGVDRAAWDAVAQRVVLGRDVSRGDDVNSHLRAIVGRLLDLELVDDPAIAAALAMPATEPGAFRLRQLEGHPSPLLRAVHSAYTHSGELHASMIRELMNVVSTTPDFRLKYDDMDIVLTAEAPSLAAKNAALIPMAQRLQVFDATARLQAEHDARAAVAPLAQHRDVLADAVDELIAEGRCNAEAKAELLDAFDAFVEPARRFVAGEAGALDEAYFVQRRRFSLMVSVLKQTGIDWKTKLPTKTEKLVNRAVDAADNRVTHVSCARQTIAPLLVADPGAITRYLAAPTAENLDGVSLDLAAKLAERVAFYEGVPSGSAASALFGFTPDLLVARDVAKGALEKKSVTFLDAVAIGDEDRRKLAPLGPGFQGVLETIVARHGTGRLADEWYNKLIKDVAWPHILQRGLTETDPKKALAYALAFVEMNVASTEVMTQFYFAMLMRALMLVEKKPDMDVYASLLALFIHGSSFADIDFAEFLNAKEEDLAKIAQVRYREAYFDRLVDRLDEFKSWTGQAQSRLAKARVVLAKIANVLYAEADKYATPTNYESRDQLGMHPVLWGLWLLKNSLYPTVSEAPWLTSITRKVKRACATLYTRALAQNGFDVGRVNRTDFLSDLPAMTVWSSHLDRAIVDYVAQADFDGVSRGKRAERAAAVELIKNVKSLEARSAAYRDLLAKHGPAKMGFMERLRAYRDLWQKYQKARDVWTDEVLQDLQKASGLIERWKIAEKAWEDHVKRRAADRGIGKPEALKLLLDLYEAKQKVDCAPASEAASVFKEGSKHRDEFLERFVKGRATDLEQLKMVESFKSQNTETPYHKMAKVFFEFMDDEAKKLSNLERAHFALYVAGLGDLSPAIASKVRDLAKGSSGRRKVLANSGIDIRPSDVRTFVGQAHPEERLVAFRGMIMRGIIGDPQAEKVLTDRLLFADAKMPPFLRKSLEIFLRVISPEERSIYISALLANSNGKPLMGPDIVEIMVSKGGVVAAKMAQLVASYGFDLDPEYRAKLEKFKGKAQQVDKMMFAQWAKQLLPPGKFEQIKTFDEELGSGSFKIGYKCTLVDGRKVVMMIPREHVIEHTAREFEITRRVIAEIMKDPELRQENIEPLQKEVERIVGGEMMFANEERFMKEHKVAHDERPWLVRVEGNAVRVLIPQPLDGWCNDKILVEEYVESKGFSGLPDKAVWGWSKQRLAKAAIGEIVNQLLSFMDASERKDGKVTLDIDPHEENQLAQSGWLGGRRRMVNIDLGQSVSIPPEDARAIVHMLGFIYLNKVDEAVAQAERFMDFRGPEQREAFRASLADKRRRQSDPFECMGATFDEVGLKGVFLKPEFLYFQKLFATMVGLKRHVDDPAFITKQTQRVLGLRAIANPRSMWRELKAGVAQLTLLQKARS